MSEFDIILDNSQQNLKEVPTTILSMHNLKMLYLQQNFIKEIPKDFFLNLPQLSWLDLRSNHLTALPETVAHHQHLENLLLSDNKIEALPNELGLVPKLKVLQVANNPLAYPNSRVIAEGTKSITNYLRHQYEKTASPPSQTNKNDNLREEQEMKMEKEIRVMADYTHYFPKRQESVDSSLVVKGLSKVKPQASGIIHKVSTTSANKILIKSYYPEEDDRYVKTSTQTSDSISCIPSTLRHTWMEKLKQLLEEQEKILQQERNLQSLTSWRYDKKMEPVRHVDKELYQQPPPYGTDPQCDRILSREDMLKEIGKMTQHNKSPPKQQDLDKLINDLVGQLKDMDTTYGRSNSPKSEMEDAGAQIQKILEMHKKLLKLQETNNLVLQKRI